MMQLLPKTLRRLAPPVLAVLLGIAGGCDMVDHGRLKPLEESDFFPNQMASRPIIDGTVARGHANVDFAYYTGKDASGKYITELPVPLTRALLERGQQRFAIYCTPCHGLSGGETNPGDSRFGEGNGMVVARGFTAPPSFHLERLREAPVGHFYDVITHGWGAMYSYNERVQPADRWAIVAYIRALQLSQHAEYSQVPPGELEKLNKANTK
jgi:mono/diheme cytochrome c family protein